MIKRMTAALLVSLLVSCQKDEKQTDAADPAALVDSEEQAKIEAELSEQKIGKHLIGTTARLKDGKLVDLPVSKAPEYYLLYFSASW